MRASSGRRASSKRPLSRCSMAVTNAWKRRPLRSTSTMSPFAMPFEVSRCVAAGGRVGGAGRRLVCSIAAATLARRPDGGGDRVPHAPVQRYVRGAVGADVQQRRGRAGGGERLLERRAQLGERRRRRVLEAEQRRGAREVEARRRGDVLLEGVGLRRDRQEIE